MTILAVGDSTTAGTPGFRSPVEDPPSGSGDERSQYVYWAGKRNPQWRLLNRGVNGERTDQIERRLRKDLKEFSPEAVIVLAGVNDLYQGVDAGKIQENLERIYRLALKEGVRVMACTILPYDEAGPSVLARMDQVNEWIRRYSRQAKLGLCDLFNVMQDPARPGKLISTADGLHPDVAGYRKMGEALADCLEKWPEMKTRFRPAWWARGAHAQTIGASLLRSVHRAQAHRRRLELPDGDFIDVDELSGPAGAPVLIVLHGLEGSSRSKQVLGLTEQARRSGWGAVAMNFRSCSGEINRLPRSYHAGETGDLAWLVEKVIEEHPGSPILCAGLSLGGNVLLKYLGERGDSVPSQVRAAAALSAPFDLAESVRVLEQGFSRTYMRRLVRSLKNKTLAKLERYPDLVDRKTLMAVRTVAEFDEVVTAPVHGFRNAEHYWSACSSAGFLERIRRPTLLINAKDDPFLPASALPTAAVSANPFLTAEFTDKGGHVGFLEGTIPGFPASWAETRITRFFEEQL